MLLELFLKPVTATKKLFNDMTNNVLIAISIAIPLLIAIIPSFIAQQTVSSIIKPFSSLGNLFGGTLSSNSSNIVTKVNSFVFNYIFQRILLATIIITAIIFISLLIYYNLKKINTSPMYIWRAMMASSIQIGYYLIIGGFLSFLSLSLAMILLIGIINSIICLYTVLPGCEVTEASHNFSQQEILEASKLEIAATADAVISEQFNDRFEHISNASHIPSIPLSERFKTLTAKQKIISSSIFSVVIGVIIIFILGNALTSKESVSKKLSQAIKNNDAKVMVKYITSSDSRLKIDESSLSGYISYLKDTPSYTSKLLASIDSQARSIDTNSTNQINSNGFIKLTTNGKKYIFFNNYVYQLPAYFIKIQTNTKNTEVKLNGKALYVSATDNFDKECGPYLPGKYKLEASLKTDYAEVKGDSDVVLNPENISATTTTNVSLPLNGQKLNLYSDYKDAKIIINGKDTGINVKNANSLIPLPQDGSCKIQLENQFPWGALKSNEQIFGKDSLQFNFGKGDSTLMDTIKPSLVEFINSYVSAYTALDVNKFTNVTDQYKKSLESDISFKKSYNNTQMTGSLSSIIVDLTSLNLNYNNYSTDKYYSIGITLSFKGDLETKGQPYFNNSSYNTNINYDDSQKKWVVNSFSSNWFGNPVKSGQEINLK